jgi:hypothetical protein
MQMSHVPRARSASLHVRSTSTSTMYCNKVLRPPISTPHICTQGRGLLQGISTGLLNLQYVHNTSAHGILDCYQAFHQGSSTSSMYTTHPHMGSWTVTRYFNKVLQHPICTQHIHTWGRGLLQGISTRWFNVQYVHNTSAHS